MKQTGRTSTRLTKNFSQYVSRRPSPCAEPDLYQWQTRLKAYLRQRDIFYSLGNTAACLGCTWEGFKFAGAVTDVENEAGIKRLRNECDTHKYSSQRHPDPSQVDKVKFTNPELQVRGVWKKLKIRSEGGLSSPPTRLRHSGFVWKGETWAGILLAKFLPDHCI